MFTPAIIVVFSGTLGAKHSILFMIIRSIHLQFSGKLDAKNWMLICHEYLTASVHFFLVLCSSHVIFTVLSHSVPQIGWTALMEASDSGHTNVVQLLLSSGAKVDLQNKVRHNIKYLVPKLQCI